MLTVTVVLQRFFASVWEAVFNFNPKLHYFYPTTIFNKTWYLFKKKKNIIDRPYNQSSPTNVPTYSFHKSHLHSFPVHLPLTLSRDDPFSRISRVALVLLHGHRGGWTCRGGLIPSKLYKLATLRSSSSVSPFASVVRGLRTGWEANVWRWSK